MSHWLPWALLRELEQEGGEGKLHPPGQGCGPELGTDPKDRSRLLGISRLWVGRSPGAGGPKECPVFLGTMAGEAGLQSPSQDRRRLARA